jgi:DeoR/GlpR family transcriptional regulator of sugar metabolism
MIKEILEENETLIPAQRYELIQEYLVNNKIATYAALARLLEVSESTVRRDLEWMESQGILERTRGGAIFSQRIRAETEYIQRAQSNIEEKRLIGAAAAKFIEPGDLIFINSGTTTAQVINHIKGVPNVTVITNNTSALTEMQEIDYDLMLLGGSYMPHSNAVIGHFAIENIRQVNATKSFIGIEGISLKYGCTVPTQMEAELVRLMIENTQGPVIIVTDHSKWGSVSNYLLAKIEQIHKLITDEKLDVNARMALAVRGVDVIIAGKTK